MLVSCLPRQSNWRVRIQARQPICKVCVSRLARGGVYSAKGGAPRFGGTSRAGKKRSPVPNLFWCGGKGLESECPPGIFARPRSCPVVNAKRSTTGVSAACGGEKRSAKIFLIFSCLHFLKKLGYSSKSILTKVKTIHYVLPC